ncbi:MAG: hypothetical protein H0U21_03480, partial [Acidimicrobiia bacterium]|nr:hypothetical protein [Acidimicrobiia bacterium]
LAEAMEATVGRAVAPVPLPSVRLAFDNASLPWHTSCTAVGPDEPGTLSTLAAAFAHAGVMVHHARVSAEDGQAVDRFALSDRHGRKLDQRTIGRIGESLSGDGDGGGRRRRLRTSR